MLGPVDSLIRFFGNTYYVIEQQTIELIHAESVIIPPSGGNCLNWILGHVLVERDRFLTLLGHEPLCGTAETELYRRNSAPLDITQALPLDQILADLERSQAAIIDALRAIKPEVLDVASEDSTIGDRAAFMLWHETYHIGQLEFLRNLAGRHEKVI